MQMLISLRGNKHEFCLVVIKYKHVRSCPSFDITYICMHYIYVYAYLLSASYTKVMVANLL